jgi:large subunit ribosomal protein L11
MAEKVEVLVDGGKASAGPPLGPALGPLGLNIGKVIGEINEKTKAFAGMKVPVTITVDTKTKDFKVTVGTPPTSSLIIKELGLEKGPGDNATGGSVDMTIEQAIKVAKMKRGSLLAIELKGALSEVLGSAVSLHIKVDGKNPKDVQKLINEGHYNALLQ